MISKDNYGEALSLYLSGLMCERMKDYKNADRFFRLSHDMAPGLFEYKDE